MFKPIGNERKGNLNKVFHFIPFGCPKFKKLANTNVGGDGDNRNSYTANDSIFWLE